MKFAATRIMHACIFVLPFQYPRPMHHRTFVNYTPHKYIQNPTLSSHSMACRISFVTNTITNDSHSTQHYTALHGTWQKAHLKCRILLYETANLLSHTSSVVSTPQTITRIKNNISYTSSDQHNHHRKPMSHYYTHLSEWNRQLPSPINSNLLETYEVERIT